MALEAFERQHPNNRNAAIQAAFATGGYTHGATGPAFPTALHERESDCEAGLRSNN